MSLSSNNQRIARWQWLAAFAVLFLLAGHAQAATQDIRVLATGVDHSSSKASALALDYARKRAVYLVARKMQVENASIKVAALKDQQLEQIIRGATVLQTRRDGDVTYADVSVTIVDEALRRALGLEDPAANMADTEPASRSVLVIPVYIGEGRPYLWEKENVVSAPVHSEVLRQSRGAVLMPAGDTDDRRLIDYQNALEVTNEQLAPLFKRYGVDEIVIALVTLGAEATEDPTSIVLRRLQPVPITTRVEEISLKPLSKSSSVVERAHDAAGAIAAAATSIAGATSQLQQAEFKDAPQIGVTFRYATARELGKMQEAVRHTPGVLQLVMPAIALENMHGILYLSASEDDVRAAIAKQGIIVNGTKDGWLLSLR
jgi:hypothetical protein